MSSSVTIPSFRFSGLYYPDILQDLLIWKRQNLPELNDEDPNEPLIQMIRAFALVAHYNNVLIDHVALESFLDTARTRSSVKSLLSLIGYDLAQATASSVDLVLTLSQSFTSSQTLEENLEFQTDKAGDTPAISFETNASQTLSRSDQWSDVFESDGGTTSEITTNANDASVTVSTLGSGSSATVQAGDILYFGHDSLLFNSLQFNGVTSSLFTALGTQLTYTDSIGVEYTVFPWVLEYYQGEVDTTNPTSVTVGGSNLTIKIDSLVGTKARPGTSVNVRSTVTGNFETLTSTFTVSGGNVVTTSGFLGQTSASSSSTDYLIGSVWQEPDNVTVSGDSETATVISWTLPETTSRKWQKFPRTTSSGESLSNFYVRLRYHTVGTGTSGGGTVNLLGPAFTTVRFDEEGDIFAKATATQGITRVDDPSGTSSGLAGQEFTTTRGQVIDKTVQVFVDEQANDTDLEYVEVDDFLSSASTSRHFVLDFNDEEGNAIVMFGDGTNGKIPPLNAPIKIDYRTNAEINGNVGAGTIVNNRSANQLITSVTNPRPASGWKVREGTTPASLANAKIEGPASLRTLKRALTRNDITDVVKLFTTSDGASPVVRAYASEEAFGAKTVGVYVVGTGGGVVATETLSDIQEFLNGSLLEDINPTIVLNTEATVANYIPRTIDVVATVLGGNETKIKAAIEAFISPVAQTPDGVYWHEFGDKLYLEAVIAEVFQADDGAVRNVSSLTLNGGTTDINLNSFELPVLGSLSVTVTAA